MKLNELQKEFDKLQIQIKAVLSKVDNEMDNVLYNRADLDESYVFSEYYTMIDKLQQIDSKITYLKKDIKEQGVASEKCEFTTLRICMILCNIMINAAIAKHTQSIAGTGF